MSLCGKPLIPSTLNTSWTWMVHWGRGRPFSPFQRVSKNFFFIKWRKEASSHLIDVSYLLRQTCMSWWAAGQDGVVPLLHLSPSEVLLLSTCWRTAHAGVYVGRNSFPKTLSPSSCREIRVWGLQYVSVYTSENVYIDYWCSIEWLY